MEEKRNNIVNGQNDSNQFQLMTTELEELRHEAIEYKEKLYRALGEIEKQRERLIREIDNERKYAIQDFIIKLLPAKDSLEMGLTFAYSDKDIDPEMLVQCMNSTLKICYDTFNSNGVEEINPMGELFNPEYHEAMSTRKIENNQINVVLKVFQKGYLLNGRLLRPASVEVAVI